MEILGPAQGSLTAQWATLGMDMASAFVEFLTGKEFGAFNRAGLELGIRNQEDDEFAESVRSRSRIDVQRVAKR